MVRPEPTRESVKNTVKAAPLPPHLRIEPFDLNQEWWPHPGEWDTGPIMQLLIMLHAAAPSELVADDGRLRAPTLEQYYAMDKLLDDHLYVACETYLRGLGPTAKGWTDAGVQAIAEKFFNGTLYDDEALYIIHYALQEHQEGGIPE